MKFKFLFFLSVLFLGLGQMAWGHTDILNCPAGTISEDEMVFTTDNFTITHAKGADDNFASYSPWRVYTNNTVTFTGDENVQKITSVVITATSSSYATAAVGNNSILTVLTGTGTVTGTASGSTVTLTVTGDDVTEIRLKPHAQTRWNSITINYEEVSTGDHTITVNQPIGGEITPGTTGVNNTGTASFTATAESSCYTFSHWVVDGANAGSTNPYEFTNVTEDHTITAVFNASPYTITATAGANGSISPSGTTSVNCGEDQTFTITPTSGYTVADVLVNGVSVGAVTTYTFEDVTANQTISASFVEYTGPCVIEDFSNIPTSSGSSYNNRTWTGTNGGEWNATNARTDQTINGKAITINSGVLTSPQFTGGVGSITMTTKLPFSDSAGNLTVRVNGNIVGTIPYSSSVQTSTINNVNVGGNVIITVHSSGARVAIDDLEWTCYSAAPAPQISVTPTGNHDFGNQLVGSTSTPETFTITNTGNADLTIGTIALSGADAGDFSVTQAVSSTVAQGNNTTFTVSFSPTSLGSKTATVTIPNNDEVYTFTVTGNGSNSAASDIATNTGFGYTSNIPYIDYQEENISNTSHSVGVFQFAVRDGGGSADDDTNPTTLTDISFNYTGTANTIRAAALFNVNGKISDGVVTANGISFSGLSIVAPDNGSSPNITLRVSFTETVTDNQKLIFTVASATADASGSVFAQSNAGGAFSDNNNGNDRNRIEVVADRLAFAQQPTTTSINTAMAPAVTVSANDIFGNRDLDFTGTVSISSYGNLTDDPVTQSSISGLATFSNLIHTVAETGIMLEASHNTWVAESNEFDITEIVYANGDYRTTGTGNWVSNNSTPAIWEKFNGTTWTTSNSPNYNTSDNVYIRNGHTITTGGSFGNSVKLKIMEGGVFNANHQSTTASIHIYEGGTLNIAASFTNNGDFIIEDNGTVNLNGGVNNYSSLWNGTEKFAANSHLNVNYANIDNELFDNNTVSINPSTGALFGNLTIQPTTFNKSGNWLGIFPNGTYAITANDLIVNNTSDRILTLNGNFTVGRDLIINPTTTADIAMATSGYTVNVTRDLVKNGIGMLRINGGGQYILNINGDIKVNEGTFRTGVVISGGVTTTVNLDGDLYVAASALLESNSYTVNTNFNFTGIGDGLTTETTQTIDIASTSTAANRNTGFNIKESAYVQLINRNFELGQNSKLTVEGGGTLDFGFNGSTALNVAGNGNTGTGFTSEEGSYLKITSPQGILTTSGSVGNIQVNTAPVINTLGTFHYIGKEDQVTGNGIGTSSSGRAVIVEMESDALVLTPSVSFGITNNTNTHINNNNGGILDIRKGRFVETETEYVTGSSGRLKMAAETYYEIVKASDSSTDLIPRMNGNYELTGGEINLASTGNQTLRGDEEYLDLTFSKGAIKTVSNNSTPDIEGMVYIDDNTTLDVSGRTNNSFGKGVTDLLMNANSKFIVDGAGVRPQLGGDYVLDLTSEIEFTGTSSLEIRVGSTPINYAKVVVSGTNVTAGSTPAAGLSFQDGGSFTVKDAATFKVNNPTGFTGSTTASIKNAGDLATITLEPNSTIEYNGSGAQTITDGMVTTPSDAHYENLIISGAGAKTLPTNPNSFVKVNNDFTVNSGEFIIETGKALSVKNRVTNNAVANNFIVENDASLVQINDVDNIGDITAHRHTQAMVKFDATYWSSPVAGQKVKAFSQGTLDNRFYIYNGYNESDTNDLNGHFKAIFVTDNNYPMPIPIPITWYDRPEEVSANLFVKDEYTFKPGWGYSIRVPNNWGFPMDAPGGVYERQFVGVPNNGNIEVPAYGKYTMVGNPYPSAIEIEKFFNENSDVTALHFWTHYHDVLDLNYNSNYSTFTQLGGAGNPTVGPHIMNNNIEVGQGFVVEHAQETMPETNTDDWPIHFNNDMRVKERGVFQKQTNTNIEKHRFWIDLKDENDRNISQILVGYMTGATNDYDHQIEGAKMGTAPLYSLIGEDKFTVQGRALPFSNEDIVPLGLSPIVSGKYKMVLNSVDGLFAEGQEIYLKDNFMNVVHNLSTDGLYDFDTELGDFFNRFEIIYKTEEVMSTTDMDNSLMKIYQSKENIIVESEKEKILSVELYDLSGRIIHKNNKVNANIYQVRKTSLGSQILVVKVLTEKGDIVTKKIINH